MQIIPGSTPLKVYSDEEIRGDDGVIAITAAKILTGSRRDTLVHLNEVHFVKEYEDDDDTELRTIDGNERAEYVKTFLDMQTNQIVRLVKDVTYPCKYEIGEIIYEASYDGLKRKGVVTSFYEYERIIREYDEKTQQYTGVLIREKTVYPKDANGRSLHVSGTFSEKEFLTVKNKHND